MNKVIILNKLTDLYSRISLGKSINYTIILLAFSIPLSKATTSALEILLILLWLFSKELKEKINRTKQNGFIFAVSLFLAFSAISLLWSNDTLFALDYLKKYWHFLLIPIIYTSLDKKYIPYVFSAFLTSMFISEIISYGIFFKILTFKNVHPWDPSPFMDHTSYSSYLAFTAFILIYRILNTSSFIYKIPYTLFLISSVSNLFLNGGRTGQVIFLLSLLIIGMFHIKNKIKALIGGAVIAIIVFNIAYTSSPIFSKRMDYTMSDIKTMTNNDDYTNSFSARVALWGIGIKNFIHDPLIGTGIGDEAVNSVEDIKKYELENFISKNNNFNYVDYHNTFVQYLVQLGLVGFFLLLYVFYALVKVNVRLSPYKELKILFVFLFIMWSSVGLTLHINSAMLFFTLFSSLFLIISENEQAYKLNTNP